LHNFTNDLPKDTQEQIASRVLAEKRAEIGEDHFRLKSLGTSMEVTIGKQKPDKSTCKFQDQIDIG
jgi:hypothetical protein